MKVGTRFAANGIVNSYDTVNTTSSGEWKWTARHCLNSLIAKSAKDPESSKESKQWEVMPESLPIPDCWNCLPTLQLIHSLVASTQSVGPCLSTDRHISFIGSTSSLFFGFILILCPLPRLCCELCPDSSFANQYIHIILIKCDSVVGCSLLFRARVKCQFTL